MMRDREIRRSCGELRIELDRPLDEPDRFLGGPWPEVVA
jgi:hypothetical protein